MDYTAKELLDFLTQTIQEKKADNIEQIDVSEKSGYSDYLLICTGGSDLHVRAIADHVLHETKGKPYQLLGKEGMENLSWVLIDFGMVILHVFREETRKYYDLEDIWKKQSAEITRIESNYD